MGIHNTPSRGNTGLQEALHARIATHGTLRTHTNWKALPIGAGIRRFTGQLQKRVVIQRGYIVCRKLTSASEDLGQTIHLDAPDGRLDICHAIVVSQHRIVFEDDLAGAVTHGICN